MIQKIFNQFEELQGHIEQLPPEQKTILSNNVNHLSAALQELAAEIGPLGHPKAARAN